MPSLLENPLLLAALLTIPVIVLVTPFRTGWLLALVVFAWADSSMPGADFVRRAWVRFAVLLLVGVHGAVRLGLRGRGERVPSPLLALVVLAAVSLLWADPFDYPAASTLFLVLLLTVLFGRVARLAVTPRAALATIDRMTFVLLALVVLGLLPLPRAESIVVEGTGRLRGFFRNPNGLGITCAMFAPFVAVAATRARGAPRVVRWGLLVVLAVLAFFSGSRTGVGGMIAGVSVALFVRHPSRFVLAAGAIGAIGALATLARGDLDLDAGATGNLVRGQTISRLSGRLDRWRAGLELWRSDPVLGKGFMTSRNIQFIETREDGSAVGVDTVGQGVNFHSQWIETLVDQGVIGALLLAALGVGLLHRARRLAHATSDPDAAALGAAWLGTLTAVSLDSFFHNWLLTPGSPYALVFWSVCAVALRIERAARRPSVRPGVRVGRAAVAA